ncbi:MAG TPA: efflux RND transporter periplasmic adaptor subunit [Chthoniobacterales bacterium]
MKRLIILLILVAVAVVVVVNRPGMLHGLGKPAATAAASPAMTGAQPEVYAVQVAPAEKLRWQPYLETVGSLTAVNGVTVTTDLGGNVVEVHFDSGTRVARGDLLVQINVEREKAQLVQAQAKRDLAKLNLDRNRNLLSQHTISQSTYDSAEADYLQAEGSVAEAQSVIDKKTIRAPFDGIAGIRQVNVGQYLSVGQAIVTLQSFEPMYADFQLPQESLGKIAVGNVVEVFTDAYHEPFRGTITAINSEVEQGSRYIKVRATLPNADLKLRPGMFTKVNVQTGAERDVVAVPLAAVRYAPYGDSVFVVVDEKDAAGKPVKRLEQHFVKLGQTREDRVSITSGLDAGVAVVTNEVFRLRNGAAVSVQEAGSQAASTMQGETLGDHS